MIRARLRRVLDRLRAPAVPAPPVPPRRWHEELARAGVTAESWLDQRQSSGRLYVDLAPERLRDLQARFPSLVQRTIARAERILAHEFDLLGSGPFVPRDPERPALQTGTVGYTAIDWYLDPVSGLRFPRGIPHNEWNLETMRPGRADVKLPWELSRCQHWAPLGQAYRLTGDARYAVEIADELRDFMDANPVGIGINWTCTMDVALRAANWAIGLELIRPCQAIDRRRWAAAYEALFDHAAFIERNLENRYEVTSNHFLSNVVGLFFVSAVFADLQCGAEWDRQCRAWLDQELDVQVLPDGADFESSIPYHRLVTELFLGAARVANFGGTPLPARVLERLHSMVRFLGAVLRPDGLMPQVGDADDGRLHILSAYGERKPQDARHLFGPASALLRAGFGAHDAEWGEWETAWWGLSDSGPRPLPTAEAVTTFPDAGIVVCRTRDEYLLVTSGRVGTNGFGNHKHNDLLGFEYHVAGVPLLVDPGSYVYTSDPEARNLFRSTRSHNTAMVDDVEQNEFRPEWLFRMFESSPPSPLTVTHSDGHVAIVGRHGAWTRLPDPVVHERTFTLSTTRRGLRILDRLSGSGAHRVTWHFHCAPGVTVTETGAGRYELQAGSVGVILTMPTGTEATVVGASYSPSYGVRMPCTAINVAASMPRASEYLFTLETQ